MTREPDWEEAEPSVPVQRGAAAAFVAKLPLFAAYEWSVWLDSGSYRNTSELLLSTPLGPLGEWASVARLLGLLAIGAAAAVSLARRDRSPLRDGLTISVEGFVWGFVLGPLMLLVLATLGDAAPTLRLAGGPPADLPGLQRIAYSLGAAAWEELLFRLGAYSLIYLLARRVVLFLGAGRNAASWFGEASGLTLSALFFAAFHLESFTGWMGLGGEAYEPGRFLWKLVAGLLLGVLFRLRGAGVAAWAHGVFNSALVLGAGPGGFL